MCLSVTAALLPGDPLMLNEPPKGPAVVMVTCIYSSMATSRKGAATIYLCQSRAFIMCDVTEAPFLKVSLH